MIECLSFAWHFYLQLSMKLFVVILLFVVQPVLVLSQSISGRIFDSASKPIEGASVAVVGTSAGTATASDGGFSITYKGGFPVELSVSSIGFESKIITLNALTSNLLIVLKSTSVSIDDVEVKGTQQQSNFQTIDSKTAAVVVDVAGGIEGVVKSQMGVSSNSELSSQYRVRGGNFDENMIYVNGVEVYRPFLIRSGEQEGLSFVNPDMVGNIQFSSGGFDASYGDKMSSVLNVNYKVPSATAGNVKLSLLGGSAYFGGSNFNNRLSHITGVRYKTNQYLLGSLDVSGDYAPSFFDVQSFISYKMSSRLSFDILAYYSQNRYDFTPSNRETSFGTISDVKHLTIYFEGEEADRYQTGMLTARSIFTPNSRNEISASISMYRSLEDENYDLLGEYWLQQIGVDPTSNIGVGGYLQHARNELFGQIYNASVDASHSIDNHKISWALKFQHENFDDQIDEWQLNDSAGYVMGHSPSFELNDVIKTNASMRSDRLSAYAMDQISWRNANGSALYLNYGMRIAHWTYNGETLLSPRVNFRLVKNASIYRLAAGLYYQSPLYREIRKYDGTLNEDIKSQRSFQVVAGTDLFFNISERPFKFTAEMYYKYINNLNPYRIDNVRIQYSGLNNAHGYAVGLDMKLNGQLVSDVESWMCLSLMKTAENIDGDGHGYIPRPSDQRVMFSMFFQDYLPINKSYTVNLSMHVGSGLPFGPPNSERYLATYRMPSYKRVDAGFFKDFVKRSDGTAKAVSIKSFVLGVELFNLFDFDNTISYFWVSDVNGGKYAVPNYLTSRRLNVKLSIEF